MKDCKGVRTTYKFKLSNTLRHAFPLSSLLFVCHVCPSAVVRGPQAEAVQKLAKIIDETPTIRRSSGFGQFHTMLLELRNFSVFDGLEA